MDISILLSIAILPGCGTRQAPPAATSTGIALIGTASLAADATDLSGLRDPIEGTTVPQNRLGSIGSGLAWTGAGEIYIALSDRGPSDGAVGFTPRFQTLSISVDVPRKALSVALRATTSFSEGEGMHYTGFAAAFDGNAPAKSRRLDPEGVRVSKSGTLYTSDEYGPWIDEWSARGVRLRRLALPPKFAVAHPSATPADELPPKNVAGRQSNRGMEGLALSPDGKLLYGAMQSPLIQDGALDGKNKRVGTNVRVLEVELGSGATREFLYCLDDAKNGVNEILAADADTLLVLERDGHAGAEATCKRIYKVELQGASDITKIEHLPTTGVPADLGAMKKQLFLDFLDPRFGLAGKSMPEKIEGLAFGPDLADDGRHLLLVSIDNDFKPDVPNIFWAFAIDRALLPDYQPALFDVGWLGAR